MASCQWNADYEPNLDQSLRYAGDLNVVNDKNLLGLKVFFCRYF